MSVRVSKRTSQACGKDRRKSQPWHHSRHFSSVLMIRSLCSEMNGSSTSALAIQLIALPCLSLENFSVWSPREFVCLRWASPSPANSAATKESPMCKKSCEANGTPKSPQAKVCQFLGISMASWKSTIRSHAAKKNLPNIKHPRYSWDICAMNSLPDNKATAKQEFPRQFSRLHSCNML